MMLHIVLQQHVRRERVFRDRFNPFDAMHEDLFVTRYRFSKHAFGDICALLVDCEPTTRRSCALSVSMQLCIALRFYSQGGYLAAVADVHHVSKTQQRLLLLKLPMPCLKCFLIT